MNMEPNNSEQSGANATRAQYQPLYLSLWQMKERAWIYFAQMHGPGHPIKIGSSFNPAERIKNFSAWAPYDVDVRLCIEGPRAAEKVLHELFDAERFRGEWFAPSVRILEFIEAANTEGDFPADVRQAAQHLIHERQLSDDAYFRASRKRDLARRLRNGTAEQSQ